MRALILYMYGLEFLDNITNIKCKTSEETLCEDLPNEFLMYVYYKSYLKYCKNLNFDEKPNYIYLK